MKRQPCIAVAIALLATLVLVGCGSDPPAAPSASVVDDPGLIHVHGLGINPADDTLYAATHTGLFAVRDGAGHIPFDWSGQVQFDRTLRWIQRG